MSVSNHQKPLLTRQRDMNQTRWPSASPLSSITLGHHLIAVARHHALRQHIAGEDAEDCAMEFAVRMLQNDGRALRLDEQGRCPGGWLHRCAINHAKNFRRDLARRNFRAMPWPQINEDDGPASVWEPPCGDLPPDLRALRAEFWQRVQLVMARLEPAPRRLFVRHYLHGESLQSLAASTGKTPEAVRKCLGRACKQLQSLFARQGVTKAELCEYLALPARNGQLRPPASESLPGKNARPVSPGPGVSISS